MHVNKIAIISKWISIKYEHQKNITMNNDDKTSYIHTHKKWEIKYLWTISQNIMPYFLYRTLYVLCIFFNVIKSSLMLFYKCNRFNET